MAIRLYWWQGKRANKKENYGDLLSKYIVEKISGQKVISIKHPLRGLHKYFFNHFLVIGSIISAASKKSIVWGSGIIKKNENIRDAKFLAVRGPKTRQRVMDLGFNCPEVYGDPAILLPDYFNQKVEKTYEIGIIPHYIDYKEVKEGFTKDETIKIIDLLTNNIEDTTKDILACKNIISSSLHGVIVSQAYGIPALWVKFSDRLSGDNIKFYDYYESVGIDFGEEQELSIDQLNGKKLKDLLKKNKNVLLPQKDVLELRKQELIKSCPFKT